MPSPTRRQVWSAEELDRACALHDQGHSIVDVANALSLTRSTTRRLLVRGGRIADVSEEKAEERRVQLLRLIKHLRTGMPMVDAATESGLDINHARTLIRAAGVLIPEPLPQVLAKKAQEVRSHLRGDDVREAAHAAGLDPWWALFLLVKSGYQPVLMVPQRRPRDADRAARMALRREQGASFEQIGAEFGIGRERARRILLRTGGWTPPLRPSSGGSYDPDVDAEPFQIEETSTGVTARSIERLRFEPTGWQVDFRAGLRAAVGSLQAGPGQRLHAVYASASTGSVDVENVLTYNVGLRHFKASSMNGVVLERSFAAPESDFPHEMRYSVADEEAPLWQGWIEDGEPASVTVDPSALRSPTALGVWHSVARHLRRSEGRSVEGPLLLTLTIPADLQVNPLGVMKPVTDGVLAAMHELSGSHHDTVLQRILERFPGVSETEARAWLSPSSAPLGPHAFLIPRQAGLQVSPADDRLVGVRVHLDPLGSEVQAVVTAARPLG